MADKEAIRPIYSELQGCLAQAPDGKHYETIEQDEILNQYNAALQELMDATGKDYTRFKIKPDSSHDLAVASSVTVGEYRGKLGGIIARLHGEYFSDEPAPFASMPSTIINQTQSQSQSVQVKILLEMNDLINEKLGKAEGKEKTFLEKVKAGLSTVKNISQLILLITTTAEAAGIPLDQLASIFS